MIKDLSPFFQVNIISCSLTKPKKKKKKYKRNKERKAPRYSFLYLSFFQFAVAPTTMWTMAQVPLQYYLTF